MPWLTKKLGNFLKRCKDPVSIDNSQLYKRVTIKMHGLGAVLRDEVMGSEIGTKRQFRIKKGQFVLSRIDARNGAFGIVPEKLDGAIISNSFHAYDLDVSVVDKSFFNFYTRTEGFIDFCNRASQGTTNRRNLDEDRFLNYEVLLPSLPEQKRIVAKIEIIEKKVNELSKLRYRSAHFSDQIIGASQNLLFKKLSNNYPKRELRHLITLTSGKGLNKSELDDNLAYPVYGGGGYVGKYSQYFLEKPTIGIGRVGARCGCIFIIKPKSWITDNALYVKKCSEELDLLYLAQLLDSLDLRTLTSQTAQPVISQQKIYRIEIPVPPLPEQQKIVSYLDNLQSKINTLQQEQAESELEINALMPSVLSKAFSGNL